MYIYEVKSLSCVRLFVIPQTVAYQAPLSMGFSRQQYWSGLPFPSPGDLPNPGLKAGSPTFQTDALLSEPPGKCYRSAACSKMPSELRVIIRIVIRPFIRGFVSASPLCALSEICQPAKNQTLSLCNISQPGQYPFVTPLTLGRFHSQIGWTDFWSITTVICDVG